MYCVVQLWNIYRSVQQLFHDRVRIRLLLFSMDSVLTFRHGDPNLCYLMSYDG